MLMVLNSMTTKHHPTDKRKRVEALSKNQPHKRWDHVFIGAFFVVGFFISAQSAYATTYYVDSSITDTHVGSATPDCTNYDPVNFVCSGGSASAYKTIADVNAKTFSAGDSILLKKGEGFTGVTLRPLGSGTAGNAITWS